MSRRRTSGCGAKLSRVAYRSRCGSSLLTSSRVLESRWRQVLYISAWQVPEELRNPGAVESLYELPARPSALERLIRASGATSWSERGERLFLRPRTLVVEPLGGRGVDGSSAGQRVFLYLCRSAPLPSCLAEGTVNLPWLSSGAVCGPSKGGQGDCKVAVST